MAHFYFEREVTTYLNKNPDKINDRRSHTYLHYAAWFGHTNIVSLLIEKGADVERWKYNFNKSNVGKNELGKLNLRGYTVSNPSQSIEKILLSCPSDSKARELLLEVKNEDSRKAWIEAITRHIEYRDSLTEEEDSSA